ncbi:diguanylate cyclase [Halarcobacter ebronensis]|uniref:diguanylate cyclase n=1 Tax=Halarcobacter ebronensis TaxID=1462615 RepID=A0A4Q1AJE5_9BACT|nr:diguanylate cyclase [Halarcobacter ebronensis]QKF81979.1 response regulator receiver-modulated diguanylate cyclase [Halarcobacter ebronensis]RXK04306.1 hypothetical protein CRV07_11085 [Halarcobacter ebronensis]
MNKEILKSINILYVEDEVEVREFTSKTISTIVNKLIVAENGLEALKKLEENPDINLIVTDINMPKMGGLEMCAQVRKTDLEIPIVITSAHSDPTFLKQAIDVGVSSYALKPIDLYHLLESMVKAVEPIFLKNKLIKVTKDLENRVEEAITQTKQILDAQDNIVFLTDLSQIVHVNKKFLDFFNVDSYKEFLEKKGTVVSQFKEDKRFFNKTAVDSDSHWILQIKKLSESDRVVKMENSKGEDRIFTVTIDDYENKGEHFVVCLTDITTLKEKANLLEYQASHDQLTGLFNRQKLNEIFHKELKRDKRYENELSIILFEIDNFDLYLKEYKETITNDVLKEVADIVINSVREHDIVARWTQSEIFILLPQTNIEGALHVVQKIKSCFDDCEIKDFSKKISASFGVTKLLENDKEDSIIKRVEEALKTAKNSSESKIVSN